MKRINNRLALAVCIILSVAACSPNKTSDEYLNIAKANISASKHSDAIIALKNAIRADLNNAEARALLGSLYLNMGEAAAAEKELKRALALSGNLGNILPKLLKAFNLQRKNDESITLISELEQVTPEILLYQALAYNRLGKKSKAKQSVAQANELSMESIYSQLGNAYLKADSSDIDGALENTNKILAEAPNLTEALMLKGQLYFVKKDYASALNAFNEYHKLLSNDVQIRLFLANTYIKNEQFDEANKHLDFLLKLIPEHAFTNQLKGLVKYQKTEYKQALAYAEKAIQNGLDVPSNRVVAGLSAFKLEQYELAHQYLVTLSEILSSTHPVRRILALVQLQLGYSADASDTLVELEGLTSQDVNLFTTASFELLKAGKIDEVKKLLAKTKGIVSENPQEMTRLGILKLSMHDLEGVANLEKALSIDPELPIAKKALAAAYIENGDFDSAIMLAKKWMKEQSGSVEGYNLAAKIYLKINDVKSAEDMLNKALKLKSDNAYSLFYFAGQDFEKNKYESAIDKYNKILNSSPDNIPTLVQLYLAHQLSGSADVAIERLKQSYNRNPDNLMYGVLLARAYYSNQYYEKTESLLEQYLQSSEVRPDLYWLVLGASYQKSKQPEKAVTIYGMWSKKSPNTINAWYRKIELQAQLKDYLGSLQTTREAIKALPEIQEFQLLEIYYLVLNKQYDNAQAKLNTLNVEQAKLALMKGVQGEIWMQKGLIDKAIPNLLELYKLEPSSRHAALLYTAYERLNENQDAYYFLRKHVKNNPNDDASKHILANRALVLEHPLALKYYYELQSKNPENYIILNNLSWLELQKGSYNTAEKLIIKALKLKPDQANILDTYAQIKLKQGDKEAAMKYLKQALSLAPNNQAIQTHYNEIKD